MEQKTNHFNNMAASNGEMIVAEESDTYIQCLNEEKELRERFSNEPCDSKAYSEQLWIFLLACCGDTPTAKDIFDLDRLPERLGWLKYSQQRRLQQFSLGKLEGRRLELILMKNSFANDEDALLPEDTTVDKPRPLETCFSSFRAFYRDFDDLHNGKQQLPPLDLPAELHDQIQALVSVSAPAILIFLGEVVGFECYHPSSNHHDRWLLAVDHHTGALWLVFERSDVYYDPDSLYEDSYWEGDAKELSAHCGSFGSHTKVSVARIVCETSLEDGGGKEYRMPPGREDLWLIRDILLHPDRERKLKLADVQHLPDMVLLPAWRSRSGTIVRWHPKADDVEDKRNEWFKEFAGKICSEKSSFEQEKKLEEARKCLVVTRPV